MSSFAHSLVGEVGACQCTVSKHGAHGVGVIWRGGGSNWSIWRHDESIKPSKQAFGQVASHLLVSAAASLAATRPVERERTWVRSKQTHPSPQNQSEDRLRKGMMSSMIKSISSIGSSYPLLLCSGDLEGESAEPLVSFPSLSPMATTSIRDLNSNYHPHPCCRDLSFPFCPPARRHPSERLCSDLHTGKM